MSFTRLKPAEFLQAVNDKFDTDIISQSDLFSFRDDGISVPDWAQATRGDDGMYYIGDGEPVKGNTGGITAYTPPVKTAVAEAVAATNDDYSATVTELMPKSTIPNKTPGFVKWGIYEDVKMLIASKRFFPLFITGLSGNGKTLNIKQACAETGRGFHRVNITIETSEDDLMGGFRLKDGNTDFEYGPVLNAMEAGDVLLLDEIDLGGPKMLCLQSVLEGEGYYIKKLSKWVYPAPGFTVIATANTKGKGSSDGMFMFTNVMNEAMLERFKITIEQPYPGTADEKRILNAMMKCFTGKAVTPDEEKTISILAEWATAIRESFKVGAIESVISTRRNVIIAETFNIYNDIEKSIKLAIARFDEETQDAMMSAYRMVDEKVAKKYAEVEAKKARKEAWNTTTPVDFDEAPDIPPMPTAVTPAGEADFEQMRRDAGLI